MMLKYDTYTAQVKLPEPPAPKTISPPPPKATNAATLQRMRNIMQLHQSFIEQQTAMYQHFLNTQAAISRQHEIAPAPQAAPQPQIPEPKPEMPVKAERHRVGKVLFTREDLEYLSHGKISTKFGPLFKQQDNFKRQVRMPMPPLLLTDRVLRIDAEPGSMSTGTLYTETDIKEDSWYLHQGRMPVSITIESGQADLLLISWLGADFENRGERVYRLLGCELTYYTELPKPGDTLCYDIHVDGYVQQGDIRLFFFRYDCRINDQLCFKVRNGQAGFFSDEELANSMGVLWDATTTEYDATSQLDPPKVKSQYSKFSKQQLKAFTAGDVAKCFGPGFELAYTHSRTPTINSGKMLFLDEITAFDVNGGPWKRGYMRATQRVSPDDWFFDGHFKNDPCMPGTLMLEAGLQLMACYLTACGFTLDKDGWRFEPVAEDAYTLRCRGQVLPTTKIVEYEIYVESVIAAPQPTVFVHLLGISDGLNAFHSRGGLRLVPDWPLTTHPEILRDYVEPKPVAEINGFKFDYASLIACAWGDPVDAFGNLFQNLDKTNRVVRLPSPPYHCMSRILKIDGTSGEPKPGTSIEPEYDIPPNAWYFNQNSTNDIMPFAILMEIALQPCGWTAVFVGNTLRIDEDLFFRNLDGTCQIHGLLPKNSGTIYTKATLKKNIMLGTTILVAFDVECFVDGKLVFTLDTGFGFFTKEAFENQAGLPVTDDQKALLTKKNDFLANLDKQPKEYFSEPLHLPGKDLLMLNRVTGFWPKGGSKSLGLLRAEKDVHATDWYFKAHFYQDPVQPGSLGIEAMVQLLQFYMLHENMHQGLTNPRFEPVLNRDIIWKYRGQVVPHNKLVTVLLDITERHQDTEDVYVVADATLWVDGKCIYAVQHLALRIKSGERS